MCISLIDFFFKYENFTNARFFNTFISYLHISHRGVHIKFFIYYYLILRVILLFLKFLELE